MSTNSHIEQRKKDHISINLHQEVNSAITTGLEKYHFFHCALPEMDLVDINTTSTFLGKQLSFPVLISSMTGGTQNAEIINRNLAVMAQSFNIAMGVGSQRSGFENGLSMQTYKVRPYAPDILLFANIGAVQLNYSYDIEHCQKAVDTIGADALILHLNPLQEALMEEGDTNFSGLLEKIALICRKLTVPVVVKEVGWGISLEVARKLVNAGVSAIDVAGAGGTSWSEIEKHRNTQINMKQTASAFKGWGLPTVDCIVPIRQEFKSLPLIASGGLKDGVDIAKSIAIGADMGGIARQFLISAADSEEALHNKAYAITQQFKTVMFGVGAKTLDELKNNKIYKIN